MKKFILIAAVLVVAIVGLTSYSGKEEKKDNGKYSLIASLGGPDGPATGTGIGNGNGSGLGGKKTD